MKPIRIIVCGFGNVGRAFVRLIEDKQGDLKSRYGIAPQIHAVVDIGGAAIADTHGLPLGQLRELMDSGQSIERMASFGRAGMSGAAILQSIPADVLVEATPTNLVDGEPARSHIKAALKKSMDVITANKGPVVLFYKDLQERMQSSGGRLFMSAATAATVAAQAGSGESLSSSAAVIAPSANQPARGRRGMFACPTRRRRGS